MIKQIVEYLLVDYYRLLYRDIQSGSTVLDVGTGRDSCLRHLISKSLIVDGIEVDESAYKSALHSGFYNELYRGNILNVLPTLNEGYDVVLLSDIIEHLNKQEALFVIKEAERLGKKVIIFTPKGFLKQDAYDGNPYQIHKSGWNVKDLEFLGYKCEIMKNFSIESIYAVKVLQ